MVSSSHSVQSSIGGDSDKSALDNTFSSGETSNLPNSTIFVGDLSIFVTEGDLVLAFQSFGTIVDAKVMRCEETHKNLSYGFVKFAESAAAIAAMEELNGKLLYGRPMRISWASHKIKKLGESHFGSRSIHKSKLSGFNRENSSNHSIDSASIHVTFTSNQTHYYIDEEVLRTVFEAFGEVVDITIKKFDFDAINQSQRGYGFIHFPSNDAGIEAALRCTEELRNTLVGDSRFKCDVSHKLMKELYDRNHPSINALVQRYPSFLKVIQARDRTKNRSVNNINQSEYVQNKSRCFKRDPNQQPRPLMVPISTQFAPHSITTQVTNFPPSHSLPEGSYVNKSCQDSNFVGYYALNSFFHAGPIPVISSVGQSVSNSFWTGEIDSFPTADISMCESDWKREDVGKNGVAQLQIDVDAIRNHHANVACEIHTQHFPVKQNLQPLYAATPFHHLHGVFSNKPNEENVMHDLNEIDEQSVGTDDHMYAVASPTWFHPWNQVMYPYASYSSPPFSPTPFAFSPMPFLTSPNIGYIQVGHSVKGLGAHQQTKGWGKAGKINRFSFSERPEAL